MMIAAALSTPELDVSTLMEVVLTLEHKIGCKLSGHQIDLLIIALRRAIRGDHTPEPAAAAAAPSDVLLAKQQHVIESTARVVDAQQRALAASSDAFASLRDAIDGAIRLLDQGRAAEAREILAVLAAAPLPRRLPASPLEALTT